MSTITSFRATTSIACLLAAGAVATRAESTTVSDDTPARPVYREFLDDPYLPPSRPTAPAPLPLGGPPGASLIGVQVNIDANGSNITGDAANEPSIAIDPTDPNRIVIGFRQFDNVASNFRQAGWSYSQDAGASWTFPGVLTPGTFRSDPVLAANDDGDIFYYSLQGPGFLSCDMFNSLDGGVSWLGPTPAFGGDKAWMTIDRTGGMGHGNIYCSWSGGMQAFIRSLDAGMTFSQFPFPPTVWGTMSVAPDGTLYVAGLTGPGSGSNFRVTRSSDAQNPAATPTFVTTALSLGGALIFNSSGTPNPGGLLGQVWLATDHSGGPTHGNIYVLCSVDPIGPDPLEVHFIRSTDGGATWSAPLRINDDPPGTNAFQWFGTMSVASNGRIDVIWNDTRRDPFGLYSEVRYSYSSDAGLTWTPSIVLTPTFTSLIGWPNQNKIGDYYHMLSDDEGAGLAYAATFNGEQDVYFRRIRTYDCNANGVLDTEDISGGTSADCNANGLPDECEVDCDSNGVPDECEIAAGTAADSDSDEIPDICEVTIVAANPPFDNPYLPGQQPFRDVLHTGATNTVTRGIGAAGTPSAGPVTYSPLVVIFSQTPNPVPAPANIRVNCSATPITCPTVSTVTALGDNTFQFTLNHSIPPRGCTTFTFLAAPRVQRLRYEYLPGDVNMSGFTNSADLLALVQALNDGSANVAENLARYNINRSTLESPAVNTADVLRLVQLLNGVNTNQVWNGATLVPCPQ